MKQSITFLLMLLSLAACKHETKKVEEDAVLLVQPNFQAPASAPAVVSAPAVPSSPIVAQILNTPQEVDVITSSKNAMNNVSASDIAAASELVSHQTAGVETVYVPEDDLPQVKLPARCEQYYKRVDSCLATQSEHSEELRLMNQEARVDLATDKPTDKTCEALDKSFDAVARQLRCE